eukprot:403358814
MKRMICICQGQSKLRVEVRRETTFDVIPGSIKESNLKNKYKQQNYEKDLDHYEGQRYIRTQQSQDNTPRIPMSQLSQTTESYQDTRNNIVINLDHSINRTANLNKRLTSQPITISQVASHQSFTDTSEDIESIKVEEFSNFNDELNQHSDSLIIKNSQETQPRQNNQLFQSIGQTQHFNKNFHRQSSNGKYSEGLKMSLAKSFIYDELQCCVDILKQGIKARKFHYSRKSNKECILTINQDQTQMIWSYTNLRKSSSLQISDIQGLVYGAFSCTFNQYKEDIFKGIQAKNNYLNRKATINAQKNLKKYEKMSHQINEPFYCWECVSIITLHRTIDFVIENETSLFMKIKMKISYEALLHVSDQNYRNDLKIRMNTEETTFRTDNTVQNTIMRGYSSKNQNGKEFQKGVEVSDFSQAVNGYSYTHQKSQKLIEQQDSSKFILRNLDTFNPNKQISLQIISEQESPEISYINQSEIDEENRKSNNYQQKQKLNKHHQQDQDLDKMSQKKLYYVEPDPELSFVSFNQNFEIKQQQKKVEIVNQVQIQVGPDQKLENLNANEDMKNLQMDQAEQAQEDIRNIQHARNQSLRKSLTYQESQKSKTEDDIFNEILQNPKTVSMAELQKFKTVLMLKRNTSTTANQDLMALKMKKKLFELQRFELLLKIISKKDVTIRDDDRQDMKSKNYPPSYRFYQSFDLLMHKKVGDTKEILSHNALQYLERVEKQHQQKLDQQKVYFLKKGLSILNSDKKDNQESLKDSQKQNNQNQPQKDKIKSKDRDKRSLSFFRKLFCISPRQDNLSKTQNPNTSDNTNQQNEMNDHTKEKLTKMFQPQQKVSTFMQAMKKLENSKAVSDDIRVDQLRLKQLLNLKAKGFFLDHVIIQSDKKRTGIPLKPKFLNNQLHNEQSQSDLSFSLTPQNQNKLILNSSITSSKPYQTLKNSQKAQLLRNTLQKQSDVEFQAFLDEFNQQDKIHRKHAFLQQKLDHEHLFFSPIYQHVNDLRMMLSMKKSRKTPLQGSSKESGVGDISLNRSNNNI